MKPPPLKLNDRDRFYMRRALANAITWQESLRNAWAGSTSKEAKNARMDCELNIRQFERLKERLP